MKAERAASGGARVVTLFSSPVHAAQLFIRAMRIDGTREGWGDAERLYREVVRLDPSHWEAWNNLGAMAYRLGRKADALEAWGQGLLVEPRAAELHNNIGQLFQDEKKLEVAVGYLERAVRYDANCDEAYVNLALCLQGLGRRKAALRYWTRYLDRWPRGEFAELARKHTGLCQRR